MLIEKLPLRTTTLVLALSLIVIAQSIAIFSCPGADPFYSEIDLDTIADGYWYSSQPRSWVYGQPDATPATHRYPILSAVGYAAYSIAGYSSRTAAIPMGLCAIGVTLLIVVLAMRRFGPRTALFVGWILALEPFWNSTARFPFPYPLIALWMFATLAASASASPRRSRTAPWLTVIGAVYLHPMCGLAFPSVLHDACARRRPPGTPSPWWESALLVGAAGASLGWYCAATGAPIALRQDFGLPLAGVAPIVTFWGLLGAFMAWIEPDGRVAPARFDRSVSGSVGWIWIVLLLTGASTVAFAVTIPLLVHLASLLVERVIAWAELGRKEVSNPRLIVAAVLLCLITTILCAPLVSVPDGLATSLRLRMAVAVVGVLLTLLLPWLPRRARMGWPAGLAAILAGSIWVPIWLLHFGSPHYDCSAASRQVGQLLLPVASITGTQAAWLSVNNELEVVPPRRRDDASHEFFVGRPENAEAEGVEFVEVFHVLGHAIRLYRRDGAPVLASAYELALDASSRGDEQVAEDYLFAVLKGSGDAAAAWNQLGRHLVREGNVEGAYHCFLRAVQDEPSRVSAHVSLASLYLRDGYWREARNHLEAALEHDPG
ncbi:MAG: tetratricopeptide repeat protein, partial [Planctomycetes bacterium]|nr:tetratricopeptide repeat protein [Planctomycetota bacterium]